MGFIKQIQTETSGRIVLMIMNLFVIKGSAVYANMVITICIIMKFTYGLFRVFKADDVLIFCNTIY